MWAQAYRSMSKSGFTSQSRRTASSLVDELELHIVPLVLGGDARLFHGVRPDLELEQVRAVEGPGVIHLKYRVVN